MKTGSNFQIENFVFVLCIKINHVSLHNNNKRNFCSAHLPHREEAQGTLNRTSNTYLPTHTLQTTETVMAVKKADRIATDFEKVGFKSSFE